MHDELGMMDLVIFSTVCLWEGLTFLFKSVRDSQRGHIGRVMKELGRLSWICQQFLMEEIITVSVHFIKRSNTSWCLVLGLVIIYPGSIQRALCKLGALQISKKHDLLFWNSRVAGRIIASQRCPCPNAGTYEYATLHGRWELRLQMELKLLISWLWDG